MIKRSDGKQEEMTTLNTIPVRGGVAQTQTGKPGLKFTSTNKRADETYARTHPKH